MLRNGLMIVAMFCGLYVAAVGTATWIETPNPVRQRRLTATCTITDANGVTRDCNARPRRVTVSDGPAEIGAIPSTTASRRPTDAEVRQFVDQVIAPTVEQAVTYRGGI